MKPCKKCKIFLALPGKEYCSSCYSLKLDITPCPTGIGTLQQSQEISSSDNLEKQQLELIGNINKQSLEKINPKLDSVESIESKINGKIDQLLIFVESQVKYHEELNRNFEALTNDQDYFSDLINEHDSRGDYENSFMFQQHYQELQEKIDSLQLEMQSAVDEITNNVLKLLEDQEIEENFLKDCLQSYDGKIKHYLVDYQEKKLERRELISKILEKTGLNSVKLLIRREKP
ncbi:MAG: hypothetical protein JW891_10910 [Candidatus Lokiarchaeota archaeon]|nr:hypothetical protein [Candidatus Lokiarchaeota archaeon]